MPLLPDEQSLARDQGQPRALPIPGHLPDGISVQRHVDVTAAGRIVHDEPAGETFLHGPGEFGKLGGRAVKMVTGGIRPLSSLLRPNMGHVDWLACTAGKSGWGKFAWDGWGVWTYERTIPLTNIPRGIQWVTRY